MNDIFVGYAGLAISFVAFAVIFLLILIKGTDISWKKKLLITPLLLSWSIILYHIPVNFMGYAAPMEGVGQVMVLRAHFVEGVGAYFLVIDYNKANMSKFIPRPGDSETPDAPRLYVIKYNSDLHKKFLDAQARLQMQGRGGILMKKEKLKGLSDAGLLGENPFELYDPAEHMRKEPQQ